MYESIGRLPAVNNFVDANWSMIFGGHVSIKEFSRGTNQCGALGAPFLRQSFR